MKAMAETTVMITARWAIISSTPFTYTLFFIFSSLLRSTPYNTHYKDPGLRDY